MNVIKETKYHLFIADFNFNPPKEVKHNGGVYHFVEVTSSGVALYVSEWYIPVLVLKIVGAIALLILAVNYPLTIFIIGMCILAIVAVQHGSKSRIADKDKQEDTQERT